MASHHCIGLPVCGLMFNTVRACDSVNYFPHTIHACSFTPERIHVRACYFSRLDCAHNFPHLLINLKDNIFDTASERAQIWHACADRYPHRARPRAHDHT